MHLRFLAASLCVAAAPATKAGTPARPALTWKTVGPGVEYAQARLLEHPDLSDGVFHLVRVDPARARLVAFGRAPKSEVLRTAAEWARAEHLSVVVNAGMFDPDYRTHSGYFRAGALVNNPTWNTKYLSALVVEPKRAGLTDLAAGDAPKLEGASVVAQNLRLIAAPGKNLWVENGRRWSEVAAASTRDGKLVFIFVRSPLSMKDFNERLLGLGLGIDRAQHLEGGPEASLSVHGGGVDLDLNGSFETGFVDDDGIQGQTKLPNVIGVAAEE
jgi:hypothetical protein